MSEIETQTPDEQAQERRRVLDSLTRYLAMRDHSIFELRQKLSRRYSQDMIDWVLSEAEKSGWLTPEDQIAERLAAALSQRRKSRRYIIEQLKKRRLPIPSFEEDEELDKVRVLIEKKFGETKGLSFEDRAKAFRFLRYRGFDDRTIRRVLNHEEP